MEGVQNAGQVLPKDVRVVSVAKECCSIEINDQGAGMVLDVSIFGLGICEREQTADRR